MRERVTRKWRPSLLLVLGGALAAVLGLPLLGLLLLRDLSPVLGFRHAALLIAAGVVLATLILGLLLWRLLLNPIRALADRAARVKAGVKAGVTDAPPIRQWGTRELGDLGRDVLDMAATLQNRETSIRSFTDHVTHELKTPLTAIRGAAEMLEGNPALDPGDRRLVATLRDAARQMEMQLADLRRVAAAREPTYHGQCTLADLHQDLGATYPQLRLVVGGASVPLPLRDEGMRIVLGQLIANAVAMGAAQVTLTALQSTDGTRLDVADDGPGVSSGNRDRIFAPFFTTRREAGGTGMGLAIVAALLAAHGATITLLPDGPGARFRIEF
jgi:signal transduction histidine kinase